MYQTVDDIDESAKPPVKAPARNLSRLKVMALLLTGLALLVLVGIYSVQNSKPIDETSEAEAAAYKAYSKAIVEPNRALRRARLIDFVKSHPSHDRVAAAEAQLSAISRAEGDDWASLTNVIYDDTQSDPIKLQAIDLYEDIWGKELLGGRSEELTRLKTLFTPEDETAQPSAKEEDDEKPDFTPGKDKFDPKIDGSVMAGAAVVPRRTYTPPAVVVRPSIQPRQVVVPPRIVKNVKPRYPRRALRKRIEAEVTLHLNIDANGKVQMTEVVYVNAPRYRKNFIKAAERAALKTKFAPKMVNGRPVAASRVSKRYIFQLNR